MVFTAQISTQEINKYLANVNDVFNLNTFADILVTDVYPDLKEVAESSGAYKAYWHHIHRGLKGRYDNDRIDVYAVGDGCSPRAGVMFAMRTPYRVYSIDPNMKEKYLNTTVCNGTICSEWDGTQVFDQKIKCRVKRLSCHCCKIEKFDNRLYTPDVAIIVGVHCHVKLETILETIDANREIWAIMMPCCIDLLNPELRKNHIVHQYHDQGIPSPQNKIYILRIK